MKASVPDPWTPVQVTGIAENDLKVGVWGRSYDFGKSPLPVQIESGGEPWLAGPIRLVAQTKEGELKWTEQGIQVIDRKDDRATMVGWVTAIYQMTIDFAIRAEFDGLVGIDVTVLPHPPKPEKSVTQLWLEIPLRPEKAKLFHFWPGHWDSASNSGALPKETTGHPFKAIFWVGNEDGGLTWFSESDEGWQPADRERVIETVPGKDATILRIHLFDETPKDLPKTLSFGLQATPVKPWPKDFHAQHFYQNDYNDGRPIWSSMEPEKLDQLAAKGVRTFVFHADWTPLQSHWLCSENEEKRLLQLVADCHQRGMKVLFYFGYQLTSLAPEWKAIHKEVLQRQSNGELFPYYFRNPPQSSYNACMNSTWKKRFLDGINEALDRYGFDGVYIDGTIEPIIATFGEDGCANELHGCGYKDKEGKTHGTFPIYGTREFMRGLYESLHPRGFIINAHQSTYCGTPTLAFADSYWDGEQFGGHGLGDNMLEQLSLECFRAEFMGRNFGVPCEFLVYPIPPNWIFEKALSITMLHDVLIRPGGLTNGMKPWESGYESLLIMEPIWRAYEKFDIGKAEWHPYWKNENMIQTSSPSIKVSYYQQPGGKTPHLLMVVSNLSGTETEATVTLKQSGLESAAARDTLEDKPVTFSGGQLKVKLAPMRMRLIEIK